MVRNHCCVTADDRVNDGGHPESGVVPEMMFHKDLLPDNFKPNKKHSIGKAGMHHFDLSSTVTSGNHTFLESVLKGRYLDIGLCRCSNCAHSNGRSA